MRVTSRTAAFHFERQLVIQVIRLGFGDALVSEVQCRALPVMAICSVLAFLRTAVKLGADALRVA
jgi:hypothetical protein